MFFAMAIVVFFFWIRSNWREDIIAFPDQTLIESSGGPHAFAVKSFWVINTTPGSFSVHGFGHQPLVQPKGDVEPWDFDDIPFFAESEQNHFPFNATIVPTSAEADWNFLGFAYRLNHPDVTLIDVDDLAGPIFFTPIGSPTGRSLSYQACCPCSGFIRSTKLFADTASRGAGEGRHENVSDTGEASATMTRDSNAVRLRS